jgi:hypothetical protein
MNVLGNSGDHHPDRKENDGTGQGGRTAEQVGDLTKVEQVEEIGDETTIETNKVEEPKKRN